MTDQPGAGGANFAREEERAILEVARAGGDPACPRCDVPLRRRAIGGGSFGLGYRRHREWLLCPHCKRSVLHDPDRGTRL
jgi:transposase-like protein